MKDIVAASDLAFQEAKFECKNFHMAEGPERVEPCRSISVQRTAGIGAKPLAGNERTMAGSLNWPSQLKKNSRRVSEGIEETLKSHYFKLTKRNDHDTFLACVFCHIMLLTASDR